jgi:hypothetical protein
VRHFSSVVVFDSMANSAAKLDVNHLDVNVVDTANGQTVVT